MNIEQFEKEIQAFIEEIKDAREKRDFELLKAISGDLKDFLHFNAHKFKWSSELCEEKNIMNESYKAVKERAGGRCELCGKRGTDIHHLAGRSPLKVYHLSEFLIYLCRDCHRRFHGG